MCAKSHFQIHCSGCPYSSPHVKGARLRNSGPSPSARFECCTMQHSGHARYFGEPIQEGVPRMQRGPKAPRISSSGAIFTSAPRIPTSCAILASAPRIPSSGEIFTSATRISSSGAIFNSVYILHPASRGHGDQVESPHHKGAGLPPTHDRGGEV